MLIGDFQAYPIYKVSIKWTQLDVDHNHRIDNCSTCSLMFKQELSKPEIEGLINKYETSVIKKYPKLDVEFNSKSMVLFEYETWVLHWFCHSTLNHYLTDQDILKSFSEYIDRYKRLNKYDPKYRSLMGADEIWRWRAIDPTDHSKESPPPCRCKTCTDQGVVRIFH